MRANEPASRLARTLEAAGLSISCAESCTGGLAAASITAIPGSSAYFLGGLVAYSNSAKERLLGVRHETLIRFGAVSEETALSMAAGAASAFGSACAFSITGVAGPGGGSDEKPVGTVCFGFSLQGSTGAERAWFPGDRAAIREAAAAHAMRRMEELIAGNNRA